MGQREEAAGLQARGDEEIARALRGAERHGRRPDVDEPLLLHRAADRGDHGRRETEVPLHALATEVEVPEAEPERLLHPLVVELERERIGPRDDLEVVDLELHLAGRDVRVHGVGSATDHFSLRTHHELRTDVVRRPRSLRRAFRIHDELDDARVIAQVDEDEPTVVATPRNPARERDPLADLFRSNVAGVEVPPGRHPASRSTSSSSEAVQSGRPGSRTVARLSSTITVQPAPSRFACVT